MRDKDPRTTKKGRDDQHDFITTLSTPVSARPSLPLLLFPELSALLSLLVPHAPRSFMHLINVHLCAFTIPRAWPVGVPLPSPSCWRLVLSDRFACKDALEHKRATSIVWRSDESCQRRLGAQVRETTCSALAAKGWRGARAYQASLGGTEGHQQLVCCGTVPSYDHEMEYMSRVARCVSLGLAVRFPSSRLVTMPPPTRTAAPLPSTAHLPPQQTQQSAASASASAQQDALSVILVTGGYDNTIRFWEAWSGVCSRTINHQEHVSRLWNRRRGQGGEGQRVGGVGAVGSSKGMGEACQWVSQGEWYPAVLS